MKTSLRRHGLKLSLRLSVFAAVGLTGGMMGALPLAHGAVFGTDDRREAGRDPQFGDLSRSFAVMISPVYYTADPRVAGAASTISLNFPSLNDALGTNLCSDQRFINQPANPLACTGFLVAPDLMVTAGHCTLNFGEAKNEATAFCQNFNWLFDYQTDLNGQVRTQKISADNLVNCKNVIVAHFNSTLDKATNHTTFRDDFALIQLDHPVVGRQPLKIAAQPVHFGQSLLMAGYSSGLPLKLTRSGTVQALSGVNGEADYFRANLSAFEGDSGAPVMNANNEVVGILVRGFPADDFVPMPISTSDASAGTCSRINSCDLEGKNCRKDDHTYAAGSEIQRLPPDVLAAINQALLAKSVSATK